MLHKRRVDRWMMAIVPAAIFVYVSIRPHIRLRADMPPDFVDFRASASPAQRATEERLAREYWNCIITVFQWKYTYGSPLPSAPPEEFQINTNAALGSEPDSSSRVRYWQRLRQIWLSPLAWKSSREWNTDWLTEPIEDGIAWIENHF